MPALEGIRVIDLTEALAGPYCTMILGDLGADVVKIERPGAGDQSRKWGPPFVGSESAYYLSINRNKRSVTLDVKSAEGRAALASLLEQADVLVCNVRRVESLREAGLDPEVVRARYPRLVYCSITAYGRTGPYAGRGGYDVVAQGEAGLMAATGEPGGEPMRWPVAVADLSTGLWAATAILAALHARERTGRGQYVDQSLLEGQLGFAPVMAAQCLATGQPPARLGNRHANIVPYEVFRARDKHVVVAVGTEGHWRRFCDAVGLGEAVRDDARFATNGDRLRNRQALSELLQARFEQEDAAAWLARLRAANIPCGPVNRLDETLRDPQVRHRGMVVEFDHPMGPVSLLATPIHLSDTPVSYRRRPPLLGEHTEEVLHQAGAHLRPVAFRRPPRYAAALEVRLELGGRDGAATTLNVSEGGCAVVVKRLRPRVGDELTLHVSTGPVHATARAVVRWTALGHGRGRTLGLRVLAEPDAGWRALVSELARAAGGAAGDAEIPRAQGGGR